MDEAMRERIKTRAQEKGLELTNQHWEALEAVLAYHQEVGVTPTVRFLYKRLGKAETLRLFPQGIRTVAELTDLEVPEGC